MHAFPSFTKSNYSIQLLALLMIFFYNSGHSQSYGTSINEGTFSSCPNGNISCPSGNDILANTIKLGVHANGINNNVIRFVIAKCDASTFDNDATAYLFEGSLCTPTNTFGPFNISSGTLGINNAYYTASFNTGSKNIYAVVFSGGSYYYGGEVIVYAPPPTPILNNVNAVNDEFWLNWSDVGNENGYNIHRADCPSCTYTYQNTVGTNVTNYIDTNVDCGNNYCYKITAFSTSGATGTTSGFSNAKCDNSIKPYGLSPGTQNSPLGEQITTVTPTLSWNSLQGATSYAIVVKDLSNNQIVLQTAVGSATSYSVNSGVLQSGKTYQWKVGANCSGEDEFSNSFYFTTPPSTPPFIEFTTCISLSPQTISTGNNIQLVTEVSNTGGSVWNGEIRVKIEEVGNAANNAIVFSDNSISLTESASYDININPTINLGNATYRAYVEYKTVGNGFWSLANQGNCFPQNSSTHYGELEILSNVPGSLAFDECITGPSQAAQGEIISGQVVLKNPGTETWSGNIDVFVDKTLGNYTAKSIYHATNQNVSGGNSFTINFSDDGATLDTIMGQTGSYFIFVAYTNAPNGCCGENLDYAENGDCNLGQFTFSQTGTISHKHSFTLTPEGQTNTCNITSPDPNNPNEVEAHTAATYLCNLGILDDPTNGNVDPYQNINRGQLAKILYFALLGSNPSPTVASSFPTPFLDLIDENEFYYHAAKTLSYLQYDDMKTPFDRAFVNFNPLNTIKRGHLLKALLETFDKSPLPGTIPVAGVSPSHEMYEYVNRACDLGLIDCNNPSYDFLPDNPAQRYEAFILVWRYLINYVPPSVQTDDFFYPLNVTPENMGKSMGFADANFKHYTRTSFSIPGKKIPLVFEHVYNSFAVDLPEQIYEDYGFPLGKGWSHSYHCYIQKFEDHDPTENKLVVFWPGNSLNVYNQIDLSPITKNIYDEVTDAGNTITIKKKNQVVYTFTRLSPTSDVWLLASIKERNNNKVELFYQNYSGAKKRLHKVRGTAGREIQFFYNNANHPSFITKVEDPQRAVHFSYDGMDLKTYQDPGGKTTTYNYGTAEETAHLLLSIQLPKGNIITNTYEERKLNSTSSNNQTVTGSWEWTPNGVSNMVNMPVTTGNLDLNYEQNLQGNTTSLEVMQGNTNLHTMDIQYNDPNNPYLPTYVDVNGDVMNYQYDDMGNVEQISLPLGITHQFAYTNLNDVDYYIDPKGHLTDFAYDGIGNLKTITDPLNHATNIDYFADGFVKKVTNPENIAVNYTYDNFGNLATINAPEGIQVAMTYDILGRMKTYTDPNGNVTTTFFHPDDLVDKVFNPAGNESDYTYDNNNNLTQIENVNGQTTTLTYDFNQDWLKSQSFGGKTDIFEYYPDGRLYTHTDPNGHIDTYTYDAQGRLTGDGYATYDYYPSPDNQLQKVTNSSGFIEFTYDVLNRVKTVKDIYDNIITYDYDLNSNIEVVHYPDEKQVTYTYDAANRLTTVTDWNNNATTYQYYKDGRLKRTDYPNGTFSVNTYDNAGRMTGLGNFKSTADTINFYSYVLDPSGNHLQVTQVEPFGAFNWNSGDTIATYDNANHIETFGNLTYEDDENGNITGITGAADYDFHWDTADQMIQLDSAGSTWVQYTYDGLGHRRQAIRNGTTTRYVLDILGMSKVLMETDGNDTPVYYYIHGLGQIARVDALGNYHYYHYDYRGSTIAMTDENEATTHQYQYGPYGETLQSTEADFNAYRYVGAFGVQYEKEDIYFMRARYYDVQAKRFISEDPIWAENLYGYVEGNPVTSIDPKGTFAQAPYAENMSYDFSLSFVESQIPNKDYSIDRELQNQVYDIGREVINTTWDVVGIAEIYTHLSDAKKISDFKKISLFGVGSFDAALASFNTDLGREIFLATPDALKAGREIMEVVNNEGIKGVINGIGEGLSQEYNGLSKWEYTKAYWGDTFDEAKYGAKLFYRSTIQGISNAYDVFGIASSLNLRLDNSFLMDIGR